jgi:hypothetical protein
MSVIALSSRPAPRKLCHPVTPEAWFSQIFSEKNAFKHFVSFAATIMCQYFLLRIFFPRKMNNSISKRGERAVAPHSSYNFFKKFIIQDFFVRKWT